MTVRLLVQYGIYAPNTNLTTGPSEEARLLREGLADSNTSAGVAYAAPSFVRNDTPVSAVTQDGAVKLRANNKDIPALSTAQAAAFSTVLSLDGNRYAPDTTLSAATAFTISGTPVPGAQFRLGLIADGVSGHVPTFSGINVDPASDPYNNTVGRIHNAYFYNDGIRNWVMLRDTGLSAPVPTSVVRLTTLTLMTESGDGSAGYLYQGLGNSATSQNGVGNLSLAANASGSIEVDLPVALSGGSDYYTFGFSAAGINGDYSTVEYQMSVSNAGVYAYTGVNLSAGPAGPSPMLTTVKPRVRRTGTAVYAEYSTDGGNAWTQVYAFPASSSAKLYVHASPNLAVKIGPLLGVGLS